MAGVPVSAWTSTQIAEKSILDIFGKQTYLGNAFALPQNGKSLADQTEAPAVVIKNPAGSGKSLFINRIQLLTDNNPCVVRYYLNPTLNAAGSATVPVNTRTSSTATSVSLCYLGATITANGTLAQALPATTAGVASDILWVIDPGKSLLLTTQQLVSNGPTTVYCEAVWYEI